MDAPFVFALFSAFLSAMYVLLANLANQRGIGLGRITKFLMWNSILGAFWQAFQFFIYTKNLGILPENIIYIEMNVFVLLFCTFFSVVTIEYLGHPSKLLWMAGISVFISIAAISFAIFSKNSNASEEILWNLLLIIFWCIQAIATIYIVLHSFLNAEFEAYRQRLFVWLASVIVITMGSLSIMVLNQVIIGNILCFLGFGLSGTVIFIQSHIDTLWTLKRILTFLLQGILGILIYLVVLSIPLSTITFENFRTSQIDLVLRVSFLILFITPLLSMAADYFSRLLLGLSHDQTTLVKTFSSRVSGTLSVAILTQIATKNIREIFGVEFCVLFITRRNEETDTYEFLLSSVIDSTMPGPTFILSSTSPILETFIHSPNPLYKNELLNIAGKQTNSAEDLSWFQEHPYQLFLPIKTECDFVGLYALGIKSSGERYYPRDFDLLVSFAEETAKVLAKAVLYESTMVLNSELKQAQSELIRTNDRLREMDETKTAFISVISHELRTPLANIQFSLQVLEMYYKSQMDDEQRSQFEDLNRSIKQARKMIDNLIIFASFLNQKNILNISQFDFRDIVRDTLNQLRPQIEGKQLKMHLKLIGDPLLLYGDRVLVKEAVYQLISNSVKFTPKGEIWVTGWTTNNLLCFDVKDSGIGIPQEKITQVWGAFTQLSSDAVKRGVEGLGLGLSLVKYIIEAHSGTAWVESKVGVGSTFGFQLPLGGNESNSRT